MKTSIITRNIKSGIGFGKWVALGIVFGAPFGGLGVAMGIVIGASVGAILSIKKNGN